MKLKREIIEKIKQNQPLTNFEMCALMQYYREKMQTGISIDDIHNELGIDPGQAVIK